MRKNYKREINLLREDVDRLEKTLDVKSDALYEQRKLIDFLCKHDRNDVVVYNCGCLIPMGTVMMDGYECENSFEIVYLWYANLMTAKIALRNCEEIKVIENCKDKIVIKAIDVNDKKRFRCFRITKHNGDIVEVTEYYQTPTTDDKADTPTETDFKYFTVDQVRNMSQKEVKENFTAIMKSMKKW